MAYTIIFTCDYEGGCDATGEGEAYGPYDECELNPPDGWHRRDGLHLCIRHSHYFYYEAWKPDENGLYPRPSAFSPLLATIYSKIIEDQLMPKNQMIFMSLHTEKYEPPTLT
jgi:hypothetical protein